jgi:hypothetical protein
MWTELQQEDITIERVQQGIQEVRLRQLSVQYPQRESISNMEMNAITTRRKSQESKQEQQGVQEKVLPNSREQIIVGTIENDQSSSRKSRRKEIRRQNNEERTASSTSEASAAQGSTGNSSRTPKNTRRTVPQDILVQEEPQTPAQEAEEDLKLVQLENYSYLMRQTYRDEENGIWQIISIRYNTAAKTFVTIARKVSRNGHVIPNTPNEEREIE